MKLVLFTIFFSLLISCKSNSSLVGDYKKDGFDYNYSLKLNKDSTFTLIQKYSEVKASCNGKWKINNSKEIILKCNDATVIEQLQSGYINDRTMTLQIVGSKKVKLKNVTMQKVKTN